MTDNEYGYYKFLIDNKIATEKELQLIIDIFGWDDYTFESVLYARTGLRTAEDYNKENGGETLWQTI